MVGQIKAHTASAQGEVALQADPMLADVQIFYGECGQGRTQGRNSDPLGIGSNRNRAGHGIAGGGNNGYGIVIKVCDIDKCTVGSNRNELRCAADRDQVGLHGVVGGIDDRDLVVGGNVRDINSIAAWRDQDVCGAWDAGNGRNGVGGGIDHLYGGAAAASRVDVPAIRRNRQKDDGRAGNRRIDVPHYGIGGGIDNGNISEDIGNIRLRPVGQDHHVTTQAVDGNHRAHRVIGGVDYAYSSTPQIGYVETFAVRRNRKLKWTGSAG